MKRASHGVAKLEHRGDIMKRILTLATVIGAGACGGDSEQLARAADPFCQAVWPAVDAYTAEVAAANPVPDDPRYGGTIIVGSIGEIADGMNSAVASDYTATQHQQFVNLMTLLDYDENAVPRPYLAKSWDIADDNTSITFHLRDDVRWHDGEQTDAHDVAFTYITVTNPETAFPNAAWWDHYVKGPEGVEVIDDFTVRIGLRPHAEFLDPFRVLAILPEHLLGDVPAADLKQHPYSTQCPVGNGPFVFVSHATQDRWTFAANPAFPSDLGGRPFIDRYVYRVIPEQTTLMTELLTEGIDVYIQPRADQADQIKEDPNFDLMQFTFRDYVFVAWNSRKPHLSDSRVRRALTMGTDRESIVEAILQGYGSVANGGVPPFHWAFDAELPVTVGYDPEAASALLEDAGWTDRDGDGIRENADGVRLEFSVKYNSGNQQRRDIAEIMQAQLQKIGVAVTPQVVEWATLLQQINTPELRDFDGVVMGWVVEFKLDDMDLFHSERIDQPFAWSGTQNSEIDALLEAMSETADREAAMEMWTRYQQVVMEEQPYTYFYFRDRLDGINKRIRGVEMDARGDWVNFREWYIDPSGR